MTSRITGKIHFFPNSIISNVIISMYQGRDDVIWMGTAGYGLSYFNPDHDLFKTIYPFLNSDPSMIDTWCRASCEDDNGNILAGHRQRHRGV
jgi:hypothetical protein